MQTLQDATAQGADRGTRSSARDVHVLVAGKNARPRPPRRPSSRASKKVLHCEADRFERPLAEPMAALDRVAGRHLRHARRAGHHQRQELHAPRRRPSRRDADLGDHRGRWRPTSSSGSIYAGNAIQTVQSSEPKKVITVRTAGFQATAGGGNRPDRDGRGSRRSRAFRLSGRESVALRPPGADLGADHHLGRSRHAESARISRLLETVADKLGAAVGASRAAVDAGYRAE